jgi:hypothetical protein
MSFIAIIYGYNQYAIFNTNVSTFPLLDNIVSTCVDDILHLLNAKLPIWDDQINNFNTDEDQYKKTIKKFEDILRNDGKLIEPPKNEKTTKSPKEEKENSIEKKKEKEKEKEKEKNKAVNSKYNLKLNLNKLFNK